jgi:hypothetical protein
MNRKLLQILKRSDLDRPILMHDKLDFIWDKDNETKIVDHMQVKKQLRLRKIDREFQNA